MSVPNIKATVTQMQHDRGAVIVSHPEFFTSETIRQRALTVFDLELLNAGRNDDVGFYDIVTTERFTEGDHKTTKVLLRRRGA